MIQKNLRAWLKLFSPVLRINLLIIKDLGNWPNFSSKTGAFFKKAQKSFVVLRVTFFSGFALTEM